MTKMQLKQQQRNIGSNNGRSTAAEIDEAVAAIKMRVASKQQQQQLHQQKGNIISKLNSSKTVTNQQQQLNKWQCQYKQWHIGSAKNSISIGISNSSRNDTSNNSINVARNSNRDWASNSRKDDQRSKESNINKNTQQKILQQIFPLTSTEHFLTYLVNCFHFFYVPHAKIMQNYQKQPLDIVSPKNLQQKEQFKKWSESYLKTNNLQTYHLLPTKKQESIR